MLLKLGKIFLKKRAEGRGQKAEGNSQEKRAEGRGQKAEGNSQEKRAEGRRQKAEGNSQEKRAEGRVKANKPKNQPTDITPSAFSSTEELKKC
ncbi:MAG: hypothetical protein ACRC2V_18380 [Xenococcaceae cyanobacterium]